MFNICEQRLNLPLSCLLFTFHPIHDVHNSMYSTATNVLQKWKFHTPFFLPCKQPSFSMIFEMENIAFFTKTSAKPQVIICQSFGLVRQWQLICTNRISTPTHCKQPEKLDHSVCKPGGKRGCFRQCTCEGGELNLIRRVDHSSSCQEVSFQIHSVRCTCRAQRSSQINKKRYGLYV